MAALTRSELERRSPVSEETRRTSDQLVRLVQVLFALVVGQSLLLYRDILIAPWDHVVPAIALFTLLLTVTWSWIDWHLTMDANPYDFRSRHKRARRVERFRLYTDVFIVVTYAYVLFRIDPLTSDVRSSLVPLLVGFPTIFLLYIASGLLRIHTHGPRASNLPPLFIFLAVFAGLVPAYHWLRPRTRDDVLNGLFLVAAWLCMLAYRMFRRWYRDHRDRRVIVGIDLDGVLANQIEGVLPRASEIAGRSLAYSDITDWRLPIGDTDIAKLIVEAQRDREYVLSMPAHPGAKEMIEALRPNRVVAITARAEEAQQWSREWLENNELKCDDLIAAAEAKKSLHGTDVLIDDYTGNVLEFVQKTPGFAVLLDQPWNQDRTDLLPYMLEGRVVPVRTLREAAEAATQYAALR